MRTKQVLIALLICFSAKYTLKHISTNSFTNMF